MCMYVGIHASICVCKQSCTNINTGTQTREAMMTLPLCVVISLPENKHQGFRARPLKALPHTIDQKSAQNR